MKNQILSSEEKSKKAFAWKYHCDWHDENPLCLVMLIGCYVISLISVTALVRENKIAIMQVIVSGVIAGITLFFLCRWFIREIVCAYPPYQARCIHKRAIH